MTLLSDLPSVSECTATGCGYNHDGCHAAAITVSAEGSGCATFLPLGFDGGLPKVIAAVGACQRLDCTLNTNGECTADAVRMVGGTGSAHCETFRAA